MNENTPTMSKNNATRVYTLNRSVFKRLFEPGIHSTGQQNYEEIGVGQIRNSVISAIRAEGIKNSNYNIKTLGNSGENNNLKRVGIFIHPVEAGTGTQVRGKGKTRREITVPLYRKVSKTRANEILRAIRKAAVGINTRGVTHLMRHINNVGAKRNKVGAKRKAVSRSVSNNSPMKKVMGNPNLRNKIFELALGHPLLPNNRKAGTLMRTAAMVRRRRNQKLKNIARRLTRTR